MRSPRLPDQVQILFQIRQYALFLEVAVDLFVKTAGLIEGKILEGFEDVGLHLLVEADGLEALMETLCQHGGPDGIALPVELPVEHQPQALLQFEQQILVVGIELGHQRSDGEPGLEILLGHQGQFRCVLQRGLLLDRRTLLVELIHDRLDVAADQLLAAGTQLLLRLDNSAPILFRQFVGLVQIGGALNDELLRQPLQKYLGFVAATAAEHGIAGIGRRGPGGRSCSALLDPAHQILKGGTVHLAEADADADVDHAGHGSPQHKTTHRRSRRLWKTHFDGIAAAPVHGMGNLGIKSDEHSALAEILNHAVQGTALGGNGKGIKPQGKTGVGALIVT